MSTVVIILFAVCGALVGLCVKLRYDVWRARSDSEFWRKLYSAQTDYAARADQRLADCDRAKLQLQITVSELRRALGKPR